MGHAKDAIRLRPGESPVVDLDNPPKCPRCGATMEVRRAKSGRRAGHRFWGCPNYFSSDPSKKCSATINITPDGTWRAPIRRTPTVLKHPDDTINTEPEDLDKQFAAHVEEERRPVQPNDELQVTYRPRFSTREESIWMTAMSIKILLDDEDIEVIRIVNKFGRNIKRDELP